MPAAIIAVAAAVAGALTTAGITGAVVAGITISSLAAGIIGSIVATAVMFAGTALIGGKKGAKGGTAAAEDRKQLIRSSVEPRQVIYGKARVSGPMIYASSSGADQEFLHLVVPIAGHRIQAVQRVWVNQTEIPASDIGADGMVTTGELANLVRIKIHLGDQTTGDADLVAESTDGWGTDHKLLGCTYLYVRMKFDRDKFPNGLTAISAEVFGRLVADPRNGQITYSPNWALCVLDFLRSEHGLACSDDEIDYPSFVAAANLSDERVQLDADATDFHARYDICGSFKLDRAPIDVLEEILAAGGGTLVYVQGKYRLHGGAYTVPTDTLGLDDFAGPIELQTRPPRKDLFNAVRGTFVDPSRNWQMSEFPPLTDDGFEAEDGERIWRDIEMPWVIDPVRAQRLAKMALRIARETLSFRAPVRYAGIRYAVWQMLSVTIPDFGWNAKAFRITAWSFDPVSGTVTLTLREEGLGSYGWLYDEGAEVGPSPDTDLINPLAIPAPTDLAVDATTALNADGAAVPALIVSWTPAAHAFVTGHEVQWRIEGGPWQSAEVPMPATRFTLSPVVVGQLVDVRVRAIGGLVRGAWSELLSTRGQKDTTAPGLPTVFASTGVIRGIALSWRNPTDSDFAKVEIQERAQLANSPWSTIGSVNGTAYLRSGLLPGDKLYHRIRALDRTGNASAWTAELLGTPSLMLVDDIKDGILNTAKFAAGLSLNELVDALPTTGNFEGRTVVVRSEKKTYRFLNNQWVTDVASLPPDARISSAQIEGLEWAKLSGAMPVARMQEIQLANTQGELSGSRLTAGSITAEKASFGTGNNVIGNACCNQSVDGWLAASSTGVRFFSTVTGTGYDPNWRLAGFGSGMIAAPSIGPGQEMYAAWQGTSATGIAAVPAQAGQTWEGQARIAPSACNAYVRLQALDGNGNGLAISASPVVPPMPQGRAVYLDDYHLCWTKLTCPPGTAWVRLLVGTAPSGSVTWTAPFVFWTQALLGPCQASLGEPSKWSPGGTTDITGGMMRSDTIGARHVIAGSITTEKLSVGSGTNDIWNSCFTGGTDGWSFGGTVPGAGMGVARFLATSDTQLPDYRMLGLGTGYMQLIGGAGLAGGGELVCDWTPGGNSVGVSVTAGQRYHGAAMLNTHRCQGAAYIIWRDGAGNVLGESAGNVVNSQIGSGVNDVHYRRSTVVATAPAGAVWGAFRVRMLPLAGEGNPFLFVTKTMFGAAPVNATQVPDWTAGGVTQVAGGAIRTNSIDADRILAGSIGAREVRADQIRAAVIQVGAIRADEIAVGEIRARHLASETIISQAVQLGTAVISAAQIQDLTVGTLKIANGALSGWTFARIGGGQSLGRPGSGYNLVRYLGASINVETGAQRNVLILHQAYGINQNITYAAGGGGGSPNPGEGGGGGGSAGE